MANLAWKLSKTRFSSEHWTIYPKFEIRDNPGIKNYPLFHYDVNSLYPFCSVNPLPGRILGIDLNPSIDCLFGFIMGSIELKSENIKIKGQGTLFSEEVKFLMKNGAKVKVNWAVIHEPIVNNNLDFVLSLSNKKEQKLSNSIEMKKLLNFWYGRMSYQNPNTSKLEGKRSWALAIMAYARIHMYPFRMGAYGPCFVNKLDSVCLNHPLPQHLIGNKMGLFKITTGCY